MTRSPTDDRQGNAGHRDRREQRVEQGARPTGDLGLQPEHVVEPRVHDGGELGAAPEQERLPQARAQVVASGDALLHDGRMIGPGRFLDHLAASHLRQQGAHDPASGDAGDGQ